jgi:putative endonuclease
VELHKTAIGRRAEEIAAQYLEDRGFRILWRNARIGSLEVDIVALRDGLAIVVEVRYRGPGALAGPLASITPKKQQMLLRATRGLWRGRLKKMPEVHRMRIDVIAVTPACGDYAIEWIRGAITE